MSTTVAHSYLAYPGDPGPGTARNLEMSEIPNHIHAVDMARDVATSTQSDKRVVIFPLKLAQTFPKDAQ